MNSSDILTIDSLHIKNFKSITDTSFQFDEKNLIIFDGPNGYGKTTVFEAIEIVLSKTPRKYRTFAINAGLSYEDSPIHKDKDLPIEFTLYLKNGKEIVSIKRTFPRAPNRKCQENNIRKIFDTSELYINNQKGTEEELARQLGFPNITTLFNVLNYVEQDENTFFLKKDPKERYRDLSSLLGAEKQIEQLNKIKSFSGELKKTIKSTNDKIKDIKDKNRDVLNTESSDITYKRLIEWKDFVWDLENLTNVQIDIRNSYLSELERIKYVYLHKNILKDIYRWHNMGKYANDIFFDKLINYYWKIENIETLRAELDIRKRHRSILSKNQKLTEAIDKLNYNYFKEDLNLEYLREKNIIDVDVFKTKLSLFLTQKEALGLQSGILNNLKNKRTELLNIQTEHKGIINLKEGECPTCGFDWESTENLLDHINKTEQQIFREYNNLNKNFENLKSEIHLFFSVLKEKIVLDNQQIKEKLTLLVSDESFSDLDRNQAEYKGEIENFFSLIGEEDKQSIISFINIRSLPENIDLLKDQIKEIINKGRPNISSEIDTQQLRSDFDTYFQNNETFLNQLSEGDIKNKSSYIMTQYYLAINKSLNNLVEKIANLESYLKKVTSLEQILDETIKEYTKKIVNDVTIPFYIYTGKILQRHSLGSGLVLDLDVSKKDSHLKINPLGRDQEVSYTLSSGQLSATIISLTLILNKVYNKSKLGTILIDDPLQTLDEINTHSLIEVLKYNFSNQQVVLSTHESRYSKLIRYKFDKFKLSSKNIRMKDMV